MLCYRILYKSILQVFVGPDCGKPRRKIRDAAASFKADLQAGKKMTIVNQFAIKLPPVNSHKFHTTEGEVIIRWANE
jgi:hypothetical protein